MEICPDWLDADPKTVLVNDYDEREIELQAAVKKNLENNVAKRNADYNKYDKTLDFNKKKLKEMESRNLQDQIAIKKIDDKIKKLAINKNSRQTSCSNQPTVSRGSVFLLLASLPILTLLVILLFKVLNTPVLPIKPLTDLDQLNISIDSLIDDGYNIVDVQNLKADAIYQYPIAGDMIFVLLADIPFRYGMIGDSDRSMIVNRGERLELGQRNTIYTVQAQALSATSFVLMFKNRDIGHPIAVITKFTDSVVKMFTSILGVVGIIAVVVLITVVLILDIILLVKMVQRSQF
ncbi:hypothetical protein COT94_03795 [Candidatus Falkowbacteria bacterium CG10_big_fil_rev_8_21_14_0_10_37_14]|uniref:Uncharacterized protein n=1 Tax=Candidatus Falkowbacteria bacterium CG10_big_fil_rev_8_21_14_0_10_37_14 TaxID=1974561 RepID=A0A2M6WSK6_9BACT|nr:hypothetical protein [Candidatus Falkowbacteria bacterium]PIT95686.1 MAG: hypothetical protein COT94_03795 [Candidatus Falkowbacteria bacterium CG10_big_fil_rev_8_21_14_0_10_37_14]